MPVSPHQLADDEDVLLDEGPHWVALVAPVSLGVALVAGTVALALEWRSAPSWVAPALAAVGVASGGFVALRYGQWRATRLVVTTRRVLYRRGLVRRSGRAVPLERVGDIRFRQGAIERIVGAGELTVESVADREAEPFSHVRRPEQVQELINLAAARGAAQRRPGVGEVTAALDLLVALHQRGILTAEELAAKRAQLLAGRDRRGPRGGSGRPL
ncbi:MAG TPA: PH domain-containing protein [Acidimicrobiales bacterium]|nr:PH domain-containing protein [Acidimicrobiales bacterium]